MSNRVIYVVKVTSPGPYGDDTTSILGLNYRLSKAEERIEADKSRLKELRKRCKKLEIIQDKIEAHKDAWKADNPSHEFDRSLLKPIPKWESVKGQPQIITKEMKAERKAIETQNQEVVQEFKTRIGNWEAAWEKEKTAFLDSLGVPHEDREQVDWPYEEHQFHYSIEEEIIDESELEED